MPGFIINGTGGPGPNHMVETRRKHRWVLETLEPLGSPVLLLLKEANRPHVTIEEAEMHHNQEKAWFAGKHSWESIKLVFYDGELPEDCSNEIWGWLNGVIDIPGVTVAKPRDYKKECLLKMLDGAGGASESWKMFGCWCQDINWMNLDYTSTDIQLIEVTMRYDRALRL